MVCVGFGLVSDFKIGVLLRSAVPGCVHGNGAPITHPQAAVLSSCVLPMLTQLLAVYSWQRVQSPASYLRKIVYFYAVQELYDFLTACQSALFAHCKVILCLRVAATSVFPGRPHCGKQ